MYTLTWNTASEVKELISLSVELSKWDVIRMLETVFVKDGPDPIISGKRHVDCADPHFEIDWLPRGEDPSVILKADVYFVQRKGWMFRHEEGSLVGTATVSLRGLPDTDVATLSTSVIAAVPPEISLASQIEGLHKKLDIVVRQTRQVRKKPVADPPTAADLSTELKSFDKTTLKKIS